MKQRLGVLLALSCFWGFASSPPVQAAPRKPAAARAKPKTLYLIPLGTFSPSLTRELVTFCQRKLKMTPKILPAISLGRETVAANGSQLLPSRIAPLMARQYPGQAFNSSCVLIGLTNLDLSAEASRGWFWVFSTSFSPNLAVVSSARMDPASFGLRANPPLLRSRLHKMVMKNIGILCYGMRQSANPKSALYGPIESVRDLDAMEERF